MLIARQEDMDWSKIDTVGVFSWGSGVEPAQDRKMIGTAPVASVPKNLTIGEAQREAFANPDWPRFNYPVPPITVGTLTKMVVMRKKISDGTATPQEIADFENTSTDRQEILDKAIVLAAEECIANREKKLMVSGLWSGLYAVAKAVRELGYSAPRISTRTTASMSAAGSSARSCPTIIKNLSTKLSTSRTTAISRTIRCRSSIPACRNAANAGAIMCRRGSCR